MASSQILKRSTRTFEIFQSSIHSSSSFPLISTISSWNAVPTHDFPSSLHLYPRSFCKRNIDNPDAFNHQIITSEVENLCKLISNHRDPSQLESLLNSTQIELSPSLVVEVLKKLSNAGVFALFFFRWAEKQSGFKHTSDTYDALIEALGKIKQFKVIWSLVNDMKIKGVLGKGTFALISRRYARAKKVKEALEAFEKMEKFGLKPELRDYNRFLDTLCKSRQVESAHQLFDKMKNRNFKPDTKSYTILLEGWGQELNLLKLDEVYREMKADGFEPDVVAYGIIINAYCKSKKYDLAINKLNEMRSKNLDPTPHIYCSLINGLGSEKRLSESLMFFEASKSCGHPPETPTYNAIVGSYCWSMQINDAFRVIEEMRECRIGPNSRTFDIILHHLIKGRRTKEAYNVFRQMRDEFGCEPSVSTYEIMVRMFCNEGRFDMATSVWEEMKDHGVLPGMHMFATLINSFCREKKLQDACKYLEEMLDMGIRPPAQMFNNLKRLLVDEGKEEMVTILTHRLEKLRTLLVVS
ncbi:pentatricopeptide repeat-containing protein At1g71060, mitochondrial [Cynara cardunculus var. scolymus]|uniref:Pentatricopeptide repeat-containing protein n=1 Tax=Cynara cardunculus var. scolymus TaxID=59895 RepID=A0A103XVE1_CYNCS|nr:pentatricopeptide repeat-containing protein At1g71060, mitochondrial [Cynara cardunculus var. scolymus]KVH97593.1 Pentatricopeptide repeat-containing protein [Cynara cardunculus var. scolymus]